MLASKKTKRGVIGAVVLAGVLAISGFALTNALTVTDVHNAGDGEGTVATVSVDDHSIHYTLDTTTPNPAVATAVAFDLTTSDVLETGTSVWVQLIDSASTPTGGSTAGDWFGPCVIATATATCDLTGGTTPLAVVDVDQFRVVVAD